jgi:DNA-binding transcriptional regulator PaaX
MTQEAELKRKLRRGAIQDAVVKTVAVTGLLSVAVIAPNVAGVLGKHLNKHLTYRARSSTKRLIDAGYLELVSKGGNQYLSLTSEGHTYLASATSYKFTPPKRWDGRWRMVCFDIAQQRSALRTQLRHKLLEIGFERLQDSVWVFPYDCEDLIQLLKRDFGVGKEVLYVIADSIENDRALRDRFKLTKKK